MSSLPPISYASIIIGFISFAISLATLIRVVWGNLSTLVDAPSQVHYSFANLKQALYEERAAVHRASRLAARRRESKALDHGLPSESRRSSRHGGAYGSSEHSSGIDLKILQDTIRKLCKDFKRLERPFLRDGLENKDFGRNDTWGSDKRGYEDEIERYRYREEGFIGDYSTMTIGRRLTWLKSKGEVNALWVALERLQIRRMAREVTEALGDLHYMQCNMRELKLIQDPAPRRTSSRKRASSNRRYSVEEDELDERIHVRRTRPEK